MSLAAETVLLGYRLLLCEETPATLRDMISHPVPFFQEDCLTMLCDDAIKLFKSQPGVVELSSDTCIVGDLHGSLFDLLRILKVQGISSNFLFLGDYVDRGHFSVEVVTLLFALAVTYPERFTLIRGNHEFSAISCNYGFLDDVKAMYVKDTLFHKFMEAFSYMPFAALLNKTDLCVHGGIPRNLSSVMEIDEIERPVSVYTNNEILLSLVWSDYRPNIPDAYGFAASTRVVGCHDFGKGALRAFLRRLGLKRVVRAHMYVEEGVFMDDGIITVFSASSYKGTGSNKSGMLMYRMSVPGSPYSVRQFEPWPRPERENLQFSNMRLINRLVDKRKTIALALCSCYAPKSVKCCDDVRTARSKPHAFILPPRNSRTARIRAPSLLPKRASFDTDIHF